MASSCFEAYSELFTSQDLARPRFVWDPMIHKQFGEDCWIVLLRFRVEPRRVVRQLDDVLEELGFIGPCVYLLFGHYDALLRLWGTKQRVERLESQLKEYGEVAVYGVDKVFYDDWSKHAATVDASYLDRYEADIRYLTSVSLAPDAFKAKAAIGHLIDAHLIHILDPAKGGLPTGTALVKSYIALESTSQVDYHRQLEEIRRIVTGLGGLSLKSIYWTKSARIAFFVKVVVAADHFFDLDRSLSALEDELRERNTHLRIMTLIIANQDAREADLIATDVPETSGSQWDKLARSLSRQAQRALTKNSQDFLDRLHQLYRQGRPHSLFKPFEEEFNRVLEACALRDTTLLRHAVSGMAAVEGALAIWLRTDLLPRKFGTNWWNTVRDLMAVERMDFTLGSMTRILGQVCSIDDSLSEEVATVLGDHWHERLDRARQSRNYMLHGNGRVDWTPDATADGAWFTIASNTIDIAQTFNGLSPFVRDTRIDPSG